MKTLDRMLNESALNNDIGLVNKSISESLNHSISYTPNNHIEHVKFVNESTLEVKTKFEKAVYRLEKILNESDSNIQVREEAMNRLFYDLQEEITSFLFSNIIPNSKGYAKTEKDAAQVVFDILRDVYDLK